MNKSFSGNLVKVAFSRLVSLISSVLVGFLLPKILDVTDYGYYKLFTLYAVYTALLHFGFVDGILVKLAGKNYNDLNPSKMRTYTCFFLFFEVIIAFLMIGAGVIFAKGELLFLIVMLSLNMVFVNTTTYYQFISQAVQRFGEYSAKNLIASISKILFVILLFALSCYSHTIVSYKVYLIGLNILDFCMMIWYIVIYRGITFGPQKTVRSVKNDIFSFFKVGIVLTLAYQVSHLILVLDRQFVSILFSTETFAIYSFAYNIVSLISTMISSISVVLLPMLKQRSKELIIKSYKTSLSTVSMIASIGLLCYFPLVLFIGWYLPNYTESLEYIAIVLPAFLFTAVITVVMFTIAKVFDMNLSFFTDSCIVLFLGILANIVAYWIWHSPKALSYASLIVMTIWFLIADARLKRQTQVGALKEFTYLITISLGFLMITGLIKNVIIGFLVYIVWLVIWITAFFLPEIRMTIKKLNQQ